MTGSDDADDHLIRQFQRGNRGAFEIFARRYQDRLCRMAAVWLYDEQHNVDVVQEVLLRSINGLRTFHFRSTPFTWLYRTTKNVCNEFNRRRTSESLDFEPGAPDLDLASRNDSLVAARQIRSMVAKLPERQKDVVLLRVFEEMSVRDTSIAMRCREGTVKALLHKAIANLRKTMVTEE